MLANVPRCSSFPRSERGPEELPWKAFFRGDNTQADGAKGLPVLLPDVGQPASGLSAEVLEIVPFHFLQLLPPFQGRVVEGHLDGFRSGGREQDAVVPSRRLAHRRRQLLRQFRGVFLDARLVRQRDVVGLEKSGRGRFELPVVVPEEVRAVAADEVQDLDFPPVFEGEQGILLGHVVGVVHPQPGQHASDVGIEDTREPLRREAPVPAGLNPRRQGLRVGQPGDHFLKAGLDPAPRDVALSRSGHGPGDEGQPPDDAVPELERLQVLEEPGVRPGDEPRKLAEDALAGHPYDRLGPAGDEDQGGQPGAVAHREILDMDGLPVEVGIVLPHGHERDLDAEPVLDEIEPVSPDVVEPVSVARPDDVARVEEPPGGIGARGFPDYGFAAEGRSHVEPVKAGLIRHLPQSDGHAREGPSERLAVVLRGFLEEHGAQDLLGLGHAEGVVEGETEGRLNGLGRSSLVAGAAHHDSF